jgi:hypothetical protein
MSVGWTDDDHKQIMDNSNKFNYTHAHLKQCRLDEWTTTPSKLWTIRINLTNFYWFKSIYFKLRDIAFTCDVRNWTYHAVHEHLMMAVYGRNMLWEGKGTISSTERVSCKKLSRYSNSLRIIPTNFLTQHHDFLCLNGRVIAVPVSH